MGMIELFKQQGLDVEMNKDHMGRTEIKVHIGVLDIEPNVSTVSKMIRESLLKYSPVLFQNKMDEAAHKEMEDYRTFFRLLRGGE